MKTALLTLSICNEYATKIKPVQVRAPLESIQEASIITKIEKNPDGMVKVNVCEMAENAQNRCVVNFENYLYLIIKDKLLNMIDSYHYSSAFDLASASKELFNEKQKNILQLAKYREDLKTKKAKELEKILNIKILPIIPNDKSFEFLLYLKVKYKRGELIEFCRAVSPLFTEMGKIILAKYFGLIPDDYIDESSGKFKKKGNISKIVFIPDNIFKNEKEKPFIATQNLLELMILANDQNKRNISQKKDNSFFSEMIKNYGELRRMEETIRNSVAHTMSSINSKDFKDKVGKSINEFVQFLIDFYDKYINEIKKNNLTNNYDEMNKQIKIFFDINQNKI